MVEGNLDLGWEGLKERSQHRTGVMLPSCASGAVEEDAQLERCRGVAVEV